MSKRKKSNTPAHPTPSVPEETSIERVVALSARYEGPLPPAQQLAAYDQIREDLVERIVTMAEAEQAHAHAMERRRINVGIASMAIAGLIAIAGIVAGAYLLANDKELVGLGSFLIGLAPIVAGFAWRRRER